MCGEHLAAQLPDPLEPRAEVAGQLRIDFAAQALCERRALTCGGDGDLQVTTAYYGGEEEIAVRDVVDTVAEDAPLHGRKIHRGIYFRLVRRGNHKVTTIEVARFKNALNPPDSALACKVANLGAGPRRDNREPRAGLQQTLDLVESDSTRAHHQATAPFEFEKDRKQAHTDSS